MSTHDSQSLSLYQEEIMEHYRDPLHHGALDHATIVQTERNSSCGDELTFYLQIENGVVTDVSFEGEGCAISQATASMLTEDLIGKSVDTIQAMTPDDITELIQIPLGPTRLKCALLSLQAVTHGTAEYTKKQKES